MYNSPCSVYRELRCKLCLIDFEWSSEKAGDFQCEDWLWTSRVLCQSLILFINYVDFICRLFIMTTYAFSAASKGPSCVLSHLISGEQSYSWFLRVCYVSIWRLSPAFWLETTQKLTGKILIKTSFGLEIMFVWN